MPRGCELALEWYTLSMIGHMSAYWNVANRYTPWSTSTIEFQYRIGPLSGACRIGSHRYVPCRMDLAMGIIHTSHTATYELPMLRYLELDPNGRAAQVA